MAYIRVEPDSTVRWRSARGCSPGSSCGLVRPGLAASGLGRRPSPARWKVSDGEAVLRVVREAKENPVERPLKGFRRPPSETPVAALETTDGVVTVPDDESSITGGEIGRTHTEIQYLLLKLGSDMAFHVHVARNDINQQWQGHRLGDVPKLCESLPRQFDPATTRIVELIDVLWLDGNSIVAAFEVESTTPIYSGLLRMSDLVSMQPNILFHSERPSLGGVRLLPRFADTFRLKVCGMRCPKPARSCGT